MDRIHKICSIKGKATWRIYMVWWETCKETENFSSWRCMARYVEIYVRCSEKESKAKMGYRETKVRQCQTIERKILCWTKRWRIQVHNGSRSEKVGRSNASSNVLQNTDKEQWWNTPQDWEMQDKIRLCCWCRRKHETKAGRSWTQTSSRSYHRKRDEFYDPQQSRSQIHSDASSVENSRCKGSSSERMWKKKKLEKIPAWQLTKVRNIKEVIDEARKKGRQVHFASLMDLCHLKNSELEPQYQKYKGRVVLRGDSVKYDSGSYAVFTEQGSSASQMTVEKVMDIISRQPGCARQADAVSAYTQVTMEDASTIIQKSKVGVSRFLDTSTEE